MPSFSPIEACFHFELSKTVCFSKNKMCPIINSCLLNNFGSLAIDVPTISNAYGVFPMRIASFKLVMHNISCSCWIFCRKYLVLASDVFLQVFASSRIRRWVDARYDKFFGRDLRMFFAMFSQASPHPFPYLCFASLLLLSLCYGSFRVTCPIPLVPLYEPCFPSITYRQLFVVWLSLRVVVLA